jgi:hypothetical protein
LPSIVSAAIDVVLATPDQLPARIPVLEEALKNHPKAAEALAAARAAMATPEWTEKTVTTALSAKMRATASLTKTQLAAIREYVGAAIPAAEMDALQDELKAAKGPRAIARLIVKYDPAAVGLIIQAITD